MRTILLLATAALGACTMSSDAAPVRTTVDEASLDEALAGRSEGAPVNCVRQQDVRNTRSPGGNAILFDGPGGTVYLNRAGGSCPAIRPWHAIRHRSINTQLCSGELIRVFDPQTGVEYGGCTLGAFVPWRRTD
jgi:hypothetical protein